METMEELLFDIVAEGERFYLAWAGPYRSAYERCHMTQITCPRLDAFSAVGLQFHYELHYRPEGGFVRLCCHYAPYDAYVGLSDDEVRRKLAENGHTQAEAYRAALAETFARVFGIRTDVNILPSVPTISACCAGTSPPADTTPRWTRAERSYRPRTARP